MLSNVPTSSNIHQNVHLNSRRIKRNNSPINNLKPKRNYKTIKPVGSTLRSGSLQSRNKFYITK